MSNTEPGRSFRLLAPAPTLESSPPPKSAVAPKELIPRRKLIRNACRNCQAKKTKCDGKRPRCSRCVSKSQDCVYDTLYEGMTKQQNAEHEISRLQEALADIKQKFHVLRYGTIEEAHAMLASIRKDAQLDGTEEGNQSQETSESNIFLKSPMTDSVASGEHDFLPLLFNRRDWRRQPSPESDDNVLDPGSSQVNAGVESTANASFHAGLRTEHVPQQSNGFGNLPFSSSIRANYYPADIQQRQHENVFRPLWSLLPLNNVPGPSSMKESVASTLGQARALILSGQSVDQVVGVKCNIAAVFDQAQYNSTSLLSRWAAHITYSMQHKDRDFVTFASMHLVWTLARWMIDPRPETYEAIPIWLRPTMLQLWVPHVELIDFFIWPTLRDVIISNPHTMQRDWRWLEDMCCTIDCDWFLDMDMTIEVDLSTGEIHLTEAAKDCAEHIANWSVESSIQQYIASMDSIVRVRSNLQYPFS